MVLPYASVPRGQTGPFCRTFSETTNVVFDQLSEELIDAYIQTGQQCGWQLLQTESTGSEAVLCFIS